MPTVVLAEFYAIARRDAGRDVAELRLRELLDSGLEIVQLSQEAAREAGMLRARYHEKIPWGDCFIAGTHIASAFDKPFVVRLVGKNIFCTMHYAF